jgi:glycerophosphoryl diester phosphodiesterase
LPWVEVDARTTADDVLVASHDPVVEDGRFIADLTAAETGALGLMRVADLFEELPEHVGVDVDLKTSLEDALRPAAATTAAMVADLVAGHAERRRVLVTSFDPGGLMIVRGRAPGVPIGLITWTRFPLRKAIPAAVHLGAEVVVANFESFPLGDPRTARNERDPARSVAVAHEAGLQVAAWCPPPAQAELLVAAGVDCLVVDHLGRDAG